MSEAEIAWFAGVFDGEGSIVSPSGAGVQYSLRIVIYNTSYELLDRILEVTGTGMIHDRPLREAHHKQCGIWASYGNNAREILRQTLPWLIVKREKAHEALQLTFKHQMT